MITNKCGCNNTTPCPSEVDCACKVIITTDCVTLKEDLPCSNILKGQTETEVLKQLDAYICERFEADKSFFQIVNIGGGLEIYKGPTSLGKKQLRTLKSANSSVAITQEADIINLAVPIYTAGSGLSLTGSTFANTSPDQTVSLTGAGATSITGTYPNFIVSSSDTVIPQVQTDWNATTGLGVILNKPTIASSTFVWEAGTGVNSVIVTGSGSTALGIYAVGEGRLSIAEGDFSHAEGHLSVARGIGSHAEGSYTAAYGLNSHAEGYGTVASMETSHAEGRQTLANGNYAHAEGFGTIASGTAAHAEGSTARATGEVSHAEGQQTQAVGDFSHAEGKETIAEGMYAHAEGYATLARGLNTHAEGSQTTATGDYSHVEGRFNYARSSGEHSGGIYGTDYTPTNTATDRLVNYGNGTAELSKSDAFTVFKTGLATLPSVTNALIDAASGKAVVTKEYLATLITAPSTNLQRTVTAGFTLTDADNNYTIIIANGVSPITITVPLGLMSKINVGLIQQGTGNVNFLASGTTINTPVGSIIKGQNHCVLIEQVEASNVYQLSGNTKV